MTDSKSPATLGLALACAAITFSLAVSAQAQTLAYFTDFNGTDGTAPAASVIQANDGNFYGTTQEGGAYGKGSFFRLTSAGDLSSIYSFCSQAGCADGEYPTSNPILGADGNLYGVVMSGGSTVSGAGTIYKTTLDGKFATLYTFCSTPPCTDGASPKGMIQASDGNFYGVTDGGGQYNSGVIFKITPAGKYQLLHSFCGGGQSCPEGGVPFYPPIQARNGNFYGAAYSGGTLGGGVIYELSAAGAYKVIYNFCNYSNCSDGTGPTTIVQDARGNFFGTTNYGGYYNSGTVFELTAGNQYKVLHRFNSAVDGVVTSGLTLANDGNFYSSTALNQPRVGGTAYEITPGGVFTQLFNFVPLLNGSAPMAGLFQSTDGSLYGTTSGGPVGGYGTVFRLTNGLSPLVETVPVAGPAGKHVIILGNGLTGSTSVAFNGVAAEFTVESDTYLTATVPTGATTGEVSVVTPAGTLNSWPQFVVTK